MYASTAPDCPVCSSAATPKRRGAKRNAVTARVTVGGTGDTIVLFEPTPPGADLAIRLLLLYAAKIRWLCNRHESFPELFIALLGQSLRGWPARSGEALLGRTEAGAAFWELYRESPQGSAPEQFAVELDLSMKEPCLTVRLAVPRREPSVVWHYFGLLDCLQSSLSGIGRLRCCHALALFLESAAAPQAAGRDEEAMTWLYGRAEAAYSNADRIFGSYAEP